MFNWLKACPPAAAVDSLVRPPAQAPTAKQKLAFWLIAGMLSVVCVEVPAGSTMFPFLMPLKPFLTPWGILVVWPLYMLHSVFFAGLVFRFGRPIFWTLFAAGVIYGMYEAYITKVVWASFRPEGPFYSAGGIAVFETIICALFLHPLLAFIVPLLFTEILLTNSNEVFQGLPRWARKSISERPALWIGLLVTMFGLMQFVNSPSPAHSFASGAWNGLVIGLVVRRWRRTVGAKTYSLRELLPGPKGLKIFGWILLGWYVFWGFAINPKNIPGILHGQLAVWIIYAVLFVIFYRCLMRSRQAQPPIEPRPFEFTGRGYILTVALGTAVTTAARLFLHDFMMVQLALFFSFYVIAGLALLGGTIHYATRRLSQAG